MSNAANIDPPQFQTPVLDGKQGTFIFYWIQWLRAVYNAIVAVPQWVAVPASSSAHGIPNQIAQDGTYLYVCTATNTWKRIALASF